MKKGKMGLTLAVLLLCSMIGTMAFASVNDDQVTSQKIKEADGASGQNTNSGSGVKTGHIQDGAVTTNKITVSAVTSSVIANGAVTSAKIADGAVTDAKIMGPIMASKISSTGLNADTVDGQHASAFAPAVHTHPQSQVTGLEAALAGKADVLHNHDSLYQQKYGKVTVVAQTGGDYASPVAAMNNIATWCGTPSATNPCLLKVMPGVYDIGKSSISLPQYVDLEGSGENVTRIKGNPDGWLVSSNSGVRFITIEHFGGTGGTSTAFAAWNGQQPILSHVALIASGSSTEVYGLHIMSVSDDLITLSDVTISVSGGSGWAIGVRADYVAAGEVVLKNVTIHIHNSNAGNVFGVVSSSPARINIINADIVVDTASLFSAGVSASQGSVKIKNSTIKTVPVDWMHNAVESEGFNIMKIANSEIDGGIRNMSPTGAYICLGVYDSNFNPVTCP